MPNLRICILGAAGSIGSRLVAELINQDIQVTAVVRSLTSAVRIARFDIQLVSLDLTSASEQDLVSIIEGHDVIVDCTYSSNPNYDECLDESKRVTRLICDAAFQAGVDRIISLGTISVYPSGCTSVDETVECDLKGDAYGDSKLVAEKIYLEEYVDKLSITVLQLPIVYGPFMGWSMSPVSQMTDTCLILPDDLLGQCSPLFVDDVVAAILMAFSSEASVGQRILISDDSCTWLEYYKAYADRCENLNVNTVTRHEFNFLAGLAQTKNQPFQRLKRKFSNEGDFRQLVLAQWGIRSIYKLLKKTRGQDGLDRIKSKLNQQSNSTTITSKNELLSNRDVDLFDTLPKVNASKAETVLGMSDYTDFDKGLDNTCEWLKWARLID